MDLSRRLALLTLNTTPTPPSSTKFDPSLKRHQSLLTRLRSSLHLASSLPGILTDLQQLSLEKYVEEIVGAVGEGITRCKTAAEAAGAVEVISSLHQRFPVLFTQPFVSSLTAALKPPPASTSTSASTPLSPEKEKEETTRIVKQRTLLRIFAELELVGVVGGAGTGPGRGEISFGLLKDLLTSSPQSLSLSAPLAISFIKHLGSFYLLLSPSSSTTTTTDPSDFPSLSEPPPSSSSTEDPAALVPSPTKDKFKKLLLAYLDALTKKESKRHLELQAQDRRNHEAYIRSGDIFEDREKVYERNVRAWERGWRDVNTLAELLLLPPPVLPTLPQSSSLGIISTNNSSTVRGENEEEGGAGKSKWNDDEEKKFYVDLRDLKGEVPGGLLGVKIEVEESTQEVMEEEEVVEESVDVDEGVEDGADEVEKVEDEEEEAVLPAGPSALLTALLTKLESANSTSIVDSIAVEFGYLNSKAARKRLVKFVGGVPRNRVDVVPFYARLVATLDPFMKDVTKGLIVILEDEFKRLLRKKGNTVDLGETRTKNLRFLSELTKFSLLPPHKIFHILKVLLDDFSSPTSIDALIVYLEGCGRFLLRSENTGVAEKMAGVLERMKRLMKSGRELEGGRKEGLENAYYLCDPADRPVQVHKVRSPMAMYIRHLFYHVLSRNSSDKVFKLVRKLHWDDPKVVKKLRGAFTKVWKIKYSNVHLFAVLLYDLGRYHPEFSVYVIDQVLENVRSGMETNSFKYNQQRVATIKYLGELYNYRVVDSRVIFDTLWSLVTFGHPEGRPYPDNPSPIDSPDDCFRVRLVCTLLDTCGSCFERGALKKKLDGFLTFFQMYTLSKGTMPMDVEFMLADTFEQLRPSLVLFKTFGEAATAVDEMMAARAKNGPVEEELDEQADDERDLIEEDDGEPEGDGASSGAEDSDATEHQVDSSSDTEEASSRPKDPNAITQEEEDEFNRELAKMMINSSTSGGGDGRKAPEYRKPALLDVGVPILRRARGGAREEEKEEEDGIRFTLLGKKGKTYSMNIPKDSSIAVHSLEQRSRDKQEQQELKRRVLEFESRAELEEKEALKATMARRGVNLKFVTPKPS